MIVLKGGSLVFKCSHYFSYKLGKFTYLFCNSLWKISCYIYLYLPCLGILVIRAVSYHLEIVGRQIGRCGTRLQEHYSVHIPFMTYNVFVPSFPYR